MIKSGRYGRFLACASYPDCKNTKEFTQNEEGNIQISQSEITDETCSLCHAPMAIKKGRYGKFLACTKYPKCKFIKPISLGVHCPEKECSGYLTEKRSRRGKFLYSCSRYPACNFATWDKPVPRPCPEYKAPFMVIKSARNGDQTLTCNACKYSTPYSEENTA